jgi:hypothetical protein
MERGELPSDEKLIGSTIQNICFNNARDSLGLNSESNDRQRRRPSSSN